MTPDLSSAAFGAFAAEARVAWTLRAAHRVHGTYPDWFAALGVAPDALVPLCAQVGRWAARHGVTGERELFRLLLVAVSMGHRFWQDPRFQARVARSVGNPDIVPSRRAMAMADENKAWLRLLWQGDSLAAFAARLTDRLRRGGAGPGDIRSILPQHREILPAADHDRLVDWLLQAPPPGRFPAPYQRLAHLALALVHGVQWMTDPQYPALMAALDGAQDAGDLADRLAAIYGRMT